MKAIIKRTWFIYTVAILIVSPIIDLILQDPIDINYIIISIMWVSIICYSLLRDASQKHL